MNSQESKKNSGDRLAELLRAHDPAATREPLDAIQVAGLRQTIVGAAHERVATTGFAWLIGPALRPLAGLATVGLIVLSVWWFAGSPDADQAAAPTVAESTPSPETVADPVIAEPTIPARDDTTAVAVANPSPPDRSARTVQFTAPRGTRIIWTLDPNFESPIAESEARQEQGK